MSVNDKAYDDEIDLLECIETIWNGKWKIASIIAISLLSVFGFNIVNPNKTFNAKTAIKPVTSFEFDKYLLFNSSLKKFEKDTKKVSDDLIFKITPKTLINIYIEQLEEGTLLEKGIDKFQLVNKDNFENEYDYKEAVQKFSSNIKIIRPINNDSKTQLRFHHVLSAGYNDQDKWKKLLTFVNSEANKEVKNIIINRFETFTSIQEQINNFAIKDIEIQIDNAIKDYELLTKNKLAFLSEQARIARKLGIKQNTIKNQKFGEINAIITNVKTVTPFYFRGYEAIEEEIKLIKGRKNKAAFIEDLFKLEQKKRELEQNQTLERAKKLFEKLPIQEDYFKAVIFTVAATDFEYKNNNKKLYYALALVLGAMIGVVFVLINKAIINRKVIPTQS